MATNSNQNHHLGGPEISRELAAGAPLEDYLPYQLFRIVNRLTLNLKNDLRPAKMTLARWRTLSVLTATDGRSMGELANYMVIEQPALSRVIDQMERDGLVTRRLASKDNRVVQVHLTDAGRQMFRQIRPLELRQYERTIEGFKPAELEELNKLLNRLWDNLQQQA
jgi:DNA-binding MarR family transcriptional regulator